MPPKIDIESKHSDDSSDDEEDNSINNLAEKYEIKIIDIPKKINPPISKYPNIPIS